MRVVLVIGSRVVERGYGFILFELCAARHTNNQNNVNVNKLKFIVRVNLTDAYKLACCCLTQQHVK